MPAPRKRRHTEVCPGPDRRGLETKEGGSCIKPLKLLVLGCVIAAILPVCFTAGADYPHQPGCRSQKCDLRVMRTEGRRRHLLWAHIASEGPETPSALESCIIQHESGGNPQAVSGQYEGIGQWEESRWLSDGGGQYASTPLGASYAQQEAVLRDEGEAGMAQQQGQYDGC